MNRPSRKTRRQREAQPGVIAIDKPVGPTSREALATVQRRLGVGSSGHCGTLDPLASGLILVCTGVATRVQDLLMGAEKEYRAQVRLGARSGSGDAEGPIEDAGYAGDPPGRAAVEEALAGFVGEIDQVPPAHSAVRVDGERLHVRARRGETDIVVPRRRVRIDAIALEDLAWPDLTLRVVCGPGTYIRSLARDLGEVLGCGAYLTGLRRTRSGAARVEDAVAPDAAGPEHLQPLERVLVDHPRAEIAPDELEAFLAGRIVPSACHPPRAAGEEAGERIAWSAGRVVARARVLEDGVRMRRLIVDPR